MLQDLGGWAGRVFDAKTIVALTLIGCATWLATIKILDAAAWVSMCTTVGAFWGVGAVAGSPAAMQALSKLGGGR